MGLGVGVAMGCSSSNAVQNESPTQRMGLPRPSAQKPGDAEGSEKPVPPRSPPQGGNHGGESQRLDEAFEEEDALAFQGRHASRWAGPNGGGGPEEDDANDLNTVLDDISAQEEGKSESASEEKPEESKAAKKSAHPANALAEYQSSGSDCVARVRKP